MSNQRITIYDIAKELGISASYISKALNGKPGVSKQVRELVLQTAAKMNYKNNIYAANLRHGHSRTIGVVIPHINQSFFSDAIAGIELACSENNHNLIICQSHDLFELEGRAIESLIRYNVDCILISVSAETESPVLLEQIISHNIRLIQFDRVIESVDSYKVLNDNREISYNAAVCLIKENFSKIAFIGGPPAVNVFRDRREGYLEAMKDFSLNVPPNFIVDGRLGKEKACETALGLLSLSDPPDAFFTVSDHQALGVAMALKKLNIDKSKVGLFGFANESFGELLSPSLSSVDQKSTTMGYEAAMLYFKEVLNNKEPVIAGKTKIIESQLVIRESSKRMHQV